MPTIADGILCGRVCDDKKDLIEHSKDFHGLVQAKRPIFRVFYTKTDLKTDSSMFALFMADSLLAKVLTPVPEFYELLMKDEDYGRRKKKKTPPKTAKSLQSTCSAPPGNNEDDVDDEEPPLKYENFGDAPNAEKTTRGGDVRTSDGAKPASSGRDKAEIPIQRDGGNANKETDVSSAAHAAVAMVGDKEKDEESLEMQRKKGECDLRVCSKAGYIEAEGVRGRDASSGD